ncbi:hypothetical protein [Shewanella algae]|uniref:hypothetical protein n=1 Tax=Shewanella algae TaxID=38313 RepID=UPI0031F58A4F
MTGIVSQRYMSCNRSTIMVRVPGCKQRNFHKLKAQEAIKFRDKLCILVGRDPYAKSHHQAGRIHTQPHSDKSSELPAGICLASYKRVLADGSEQTYQRVIALGLPGSIPKSKSYSVMKYGKAEAIAMAIDWREKSQPRR